MSKKTLIPLLIISCFFVFLSAKTAQAAPKAVLYVSKQQNVGYKFSVDGSDSYSGTNNFTKKDNIVNFIWNFGDGTIEQGEYLNTHTHTYNKAGTYTILLTVEDNQGAKNSVSMVVNVKTLPKKTVSGNTTSAIQTAINALGGKPGIVYVPAGSYKYTGTVRVPEGVIIEGAGKDKTRVYAVGSKDTLFSVAGNNVRFTGLKLEGYSVESRVRQSSYGISNNKYKNLFVDNCEAFAFMVAISIHYGASGTVERCLLRHNTMGPVYTNAGKRYGLGYGVLVAAESYAMIRHNEFTNNRHAIAGGGCGSETCPTRYDALYNHFHGKEDVELKACDIDMHTPGHGRMRVNYNTFEDMPIAIAFRDAFNTQIKGNVFRNVGGSNTTIYTHSPYMVTDPRDENYATRNTSNSPGVDGLYIRDNNFENCSRHLNLSYGTNLYVNCRKVNAGYKGDITWNDCPAEPGPTPTPTPTPTPEPTPPSSDIPITASSYNVNDAGTGYPEHTRDKNLSTYWAGKGDGQWIKFDLEQAKIISSVSIAFYRGTLRKAYFDIEISEDDVNWTKVLTNASSNGTTNELQSFDFTDMQGRYLKITGHMNDENYWNSFTEVEIETSAMPNNSVPLADAGSDREVSEGIEWVELDGSGSDDPDGDALSTQVSDPAVSLNNADEIIDLNPVTPPVPSDAIDPIPTPEPGTLLLLGVGLIGVIALRRRARKSL